MDEWSLPLQVYAPQSRSAGQRVGDRSCHAFLEQGKRRLRGFISKKEWVRSSSGVTLRSRAKFVLASVCS